MKLKLTSLNTKGLAHFIMPLAAFVMVGVIGGIVYLYGSHAATPCVGNNYASGVTNTTCVGAIQQLTNYHTQRVGQASGSGSIFPITAAIAVDGQFGPKTAAAVMAFQKYMHIGVDGEVGPQTWSYLCNPWKVYDAGAGGTLSVSQFPGYPLSVALGAGCSKYLTGYKY